MDYLADALLTPSSSQTVKFSLDEPSFFRAFVARHMIDIDMVLQKQSGAVVAVSRRDDGDEGLVASLPVGNYTLNLYYLGFIDSPKYVPFCTTYRIHVGIAPLYALSSPDPTPDESAPSLSKMATELQKKNEYSMDDNKVYVHVLSSGLAQSVVVAQNFTTTKPTLFEVTLSRNFILGDMMMVIRRLSDKVEIASTHERDFDKISRELSAGSYTFEIRTGIVQTPPPTIANFPAFIKYRLQMNIVKQGGDSNVGSSCENTVRLPQTLDSFQYLELKDYVSFFFFEI